MATSPELLMAWRAGDRAAGNQLFHRHFPAVSRFFRNKVSDSEDLVQATFLACVEGRERFEGRSSFRTYLFSVARYQLYGHLRRNRTPVDFGVTSLVDLGTSITRRIANEQRGGRLRDALRQLPVEQQAMLELFYWESLSCRQLAEVFEISEGSARVRLHRARRSLGRWFEQQSRDGHQAPSQEAPTRRASM
ncbi:MAG: sigma-70 family RNA polymerase sigma factor [Deltaproteobacteria bacterium]|nr:sigma-70 family RNA polymerase sigma factor [Deltaproteobacteria bacterium]